MERLTGIVKNLVKEKYGFIAVPGGEDRFFRWSSMSPNSLKPFHHLHIGDTVTFSPITGENNKPQAADVEAVIRQKKNDSQ